MAAIKGKNTKPELLVRSWLHKHGFRFRLHRKDLPGKPDIVLPKYRTVIFVHGCFWHSHGCSNSVAPQTRANYWAKKLTRTTTRDRASLETLINCHWSVIVVWECETKRRQLMSNRMRRLFRLRARARSELL